jgi:hypothetical protein
MMPSLMSWQARICFRYGMVLGRSKNFADQASVETPVGELLA